VEYLHHGCDKVLVNCSTGFAISWLVIVAISFKYGPAVFCFFGGLNYILWFPEIIGIVIHEIVIMEDL
jgi:hypothetical protein